MVGVAALHPGRRSLGRDGRPSGARPRGPVGTGARPGRRARVERTGEDRRAPPRSAPPRRWPPRPRPRPRLRPRPATGSARPSLADQGSGGVGTAPASARAAEPRGWRDAAAPFGAGALAPGRGERFRAHGAAPPRSSRGPRALVRVRHLRGCGPRLGAAPPRSPPAPVRSRPPEAASRQGPAPHRTDPGPRPFPRRSRARPLDKGPGPGAATAGARTWRAGRAAARATRSAPRVHAALRSPLRRRWADRDGRPAGLDEAPGRRWRRRAVVPAPGRTGRRAHRGSGRQRAGPPGRRSRARSTLAPRQSAKPPPAQPAPVPVPDPARPRREGERGGRGNGARFRDPPSLVRCPTASAGPTRARHRRASAHGGGAGRRPGLSPSEGPAI